MPTEYEAKVDSLKVNVLNALKKHADPSACALDYLSAAAPSSLSNGNVARPPSATESTLLSNALMAAIMALVDEARKQGMQAMAINLSPNDQDTLVAEPALSLLLDSMLWLASQAPPALDLGLPASCVECLVEIITNDECHGVLAYLDSRLAQFKSPPLMHRSHHTLLRTCTLLLRRLSKSHDASLCGRALLFLAKFLPLTERSGVNFFGAFNTDNVTPIETVEPGALDAEGHPVDIEFYAKFWGLQRWFANPPTALPQAKWFEVSSDVRAVLEKFAAEAVTVTEASPRADGLHDGSSNDAKDLGEGASVKYLTSARLLPLQIRDATFRRQFLLQVLILMQWVEKPLLKDHVNQAAKDKQLEDLQSLRQKVYAALESTPERGREFAAAIRALMSAEDTWAVWKQAGCPKEPLEVRPAVPPDNILEADIAPPPKRPRPSSECVFGVRVGTTELDRLWNLTEDNVSTLSAEDRGGFRSLRQLMEPVIEEMQEEAGGQGEADQLRASANAIYSWKTLRVLSRHSLPAFAASVRRGGDLTVAARALYPGEVPTEPEATPQDKIAQKPKAEKGLVAMQADNGDDVVVDDTEIMNDNREASMAPGGSDGDQQQTGEDGENKGLVVDLGQKEMKDASENELYKGVVPGKDEEGEGSPSETGIAKAMEGGTGAKEGAAVVDGQERGVAGSEAVGLNMEGAENVEPETVTSHAAVDREDGTGEVG